MVTFVLLRETSLKFWTYAYGPGGEEGAGVSDEFQEGRVSRGCPGHPRVKMIIDSVRGKQDFDTRSERKESYDHVIRILPFNIE